MYHIFVDLEFNNVDRQYRKQIGKQEVIEFGAVVLDDNMQEVGHFKSYVKPQYSSSIVGIIRDLTGITYKRVAGADCFAAVLARVCSWCNGFGEYTVYEWSNSDLAQLLRESKRKGIELNDVELAVLKDWQDAQDIYGKQVETNTQIALETAVWTLGEEIEGQLHDALWDARNTAKVFALMQDTENVRMAKQMLHHGTPNSSFSCTLGDLFDFSRLTLAVC